MLHRQLKLPLDRSCWLFGPRQVGKTTLVRAQLPPETLSFDLLNQEVALRYAREPSRFGSEAHRASTSGVSTVFVDEVQKVPELLDEVQRLMAETRLRFILSGSSARKLRRGAANLLAGRAVVRRLHPLTQMEIGEEADLERLLRFGSLPPIVTSHDEMAKDLLTAYAQTYLREEIQAEALVRNLGGFARFLDVAASQSGEILNVSSVARNAALATRTVQGYYQILEDTLLGFRLEAWRQSPRARMVAHPRFYLFDTGVTNALCHRLGVRLDPALYGRLFEQWVILETIRTLDYAQEEARAFYWRTNTGAETDLLIEKHGRLRVAIEIKSSPRVSSADLRGLSSFSQAHPDVPTIVVSTAPREYQIGDVLVLPYPEFLRRLPEWLEA